MSFFDITLECKRIQRWDEEGVVGKIVIGSFSEKFFSPTEWWTEDQYRSDWRRNIENFLNGEHKALLLTIMRDLRIADLLFAWVLYKSKDSPTIVYMQNILLLREYFESISDPTRLVDAVLERETVSEDDGMPISEWTTTVKALENFLGRQSD